MWRKGSAMFVGLVGAMAFYFLAVSGPVGDASAATEAGLTYIRKTGDWVSWPSGHSWYLRLASTSNYPFKVTTSHSTGKAIYGLATATSGANCAGYFKSQSSSGKAIYAEASSLSGTTYGVYAKTSSPSSYAVYAEGPLHATGTISTDADLSVDGATTANNGLSVYGTLTANNTATVGGTLTANSLHYSAPRTHYYSVASEAFQPITDQTYSNGWGAYTSNANFLVASVNLPQGAVVTSFKVFFLDNSASNASVSLALHALGNNLSVPMAGAGSSGISGYGSSEDTTIDNPTIDNTNYGYIIWAGTNWDGENLKVMGALITYTINEAE